MSDTKWQALWKLTEGAYQFQVWRDDVTSTWTINLLRLDDGWWSCIGHRFNYRTCGGAKRGARIWLKQIKAEALAADDLTITPATR